MPHFKDKEEVPLLPIFLLCTWKPNSSSLLLRVFLELCIVKVWDTRPVLKIKRETIISGCSLSLECFQVQRLNCSYQMNMSLKYLHFLIIPKHLWSVDSSNEWFLSIFTSKTISALHKVFLKDLCFSCAVSSLANTQIHLVLRKKRDSGHSSCINLQQAVQHLTSLPLNGKKAIMK